MYVLDKIKDKIVKKINKALGDKIIQASDLVYSSNQEMGDLSLPCFKLSKALKNSPAKIAENLIKEFLKCSEISSVKAVGPYLNFVINKEFLSRNVIEEIDKKKEKYGENNDGKKKKIMIEYSNGNTHKECHIGHLRNICYGNAVSRVLLANGYDAISVSYVNDFGIHVAKTLWAYETFFKKEKLPENKGCFLGKVYVRSTMEIKKNPVAKSFVSFMMKKIESRKGFEYELLKITREWSIEQLDKIYKELDVKFKNIFYESEIIEKGKKIVQELIAKGILEKSQGAVVANLEKYNLGVLVILRSDGTAAYPVADIPLAMEKIKKYKLDKSIYVVDDRQSLYLKQLFKILELMGFKEKMIHLGYEFVKLPTGMMSSRSGNVITYEELREKVFKKIESETKKRHSDWDENKIKEVAKKIGIGVMKFEMIKVGADNIITFDIGKALKFEGFTATYLQYAYARINSIFRKYNDNAMSNTGILQIVDYANLKEEKEYNLILKLAKYPEVVEKAGENYNPSEIAKYLFKLAQMFNDYYHSIPILKAKEKTKNARLRLLKNINQVIENGLGILGIDIVEEM